MVEDVQCVIVNVITADPPFLIPSSAGRGRPMSKRRKVELSNAGGQPISLWFSCLRILILMVKAPAHPQNVELYLM